MFSPLYYCRISKLMMYSARCRQPWGTSRTDQDDDQDLAKLRRKRESHRGQREERGEQDYSCPSYGEGQRGEQDYSCPSYEWGSEIIPVPQGLATGSRYWALLLGLATGPRYWASPLGIIRFQQQHLHPWSTNILFLKEAYLWFACFSQYNYDLWLT